MLKENQIFIHLPKTGGTTLNCLFFGEDTPINPNYNYRHIVYDTKMSNSGDIFNPMKNDKFLNHQIFMMLRNPVDRVISEYYFLRERSEFFNLLKPVPKNFSEYVSNKQTFNYNISFLLGKKIYNHDLVTQDDFEQVINAIEKLDIKIGINEKFEESLNYFSQQLGFKLPKEVDSKRITLKRPSADEISDTLKQKIIDNNYLDEKLYQYALNKFNTLKIHNSNKIKFTGTKYDYAVTYSNRFSLFEIVLKDKAFLSLNQIFFRELTTHLQNANIKDNKSYVLAYIDSTIKTIKLQYPNIDINEQNLKLNDSEPLKKLDVLGRFIDKHQILNKKPLVFKVDNVEISKANSSFVKKILNLFS